MDKQQVQLKDVELMWPNLTEKSEMSDKYQVDLVNLDKKQVQLLEAVGLTVRDGKKEKKFEEKGRWVTAKSDWSPFPNNVFDGRNGAPQGTLFPVEEARSIGNGTVAHVEVGSYGWGKYAKTGDERSCGLNKLKIVKLVSKGGGDPFDSEKPGGDPF